MKTNHLFQKNLKIIFSLSLILVVSGCAKIATTNNVCSSVGLYNNSYDCQSITGSSSCTMAVVQSGGNNQVCWQKALTGGNPNSSPNPTSSPSPNTSPSPSPNSTLIVTNSATYLYQLIASNGIKFTVTTVSNTASFKVHVITNNNQSVNQDIYLTPAENSGLYNSTAKIFLQQYSVINYGNTNSVGVTSSATFNYPPNPTNYIFTNPAIWNGVQSFNYFDAMIAWIRTKI